MPTEHTEAVVLTTRSLYRTAKRLHRLVRQMHRTKRKIGQEREVAKQAGHITRYSQQFAQAGKLMSDYTDGMAKINAHLVEVRKNLGKR